MFQANAFMDHGGEPSRIRVIAEEMGKDFVKNTNCLIARSFKQYVIPVNAKDKLRAQK